MRLCEGGHEAVRGGAQAGVEGCNAEARVHGVRGACARCVGAVRGGGGVHEEARDLHRVEHAAELLHDEARVLDVLVHLHRVGKVKYTST